MKKHLCIFLAVICFLAGCSRQPEPSGSTGGTETTAPETEYCEIPLPGDVTARYTLLNNLGGPEYTEILETWEDFRLSRYGAESAEAYDERFFDTHRLAVIYLEEGSGSVTHQVLSACVNAQGLLDISLWRIVPEVGDCVMAYWGIAVELEKSAEFTGVLVNGQPLQPDATPSGPARLQPVMVSALQKPLPEEKSQALWNFLESLDYRWGLMCDCTGELVIEEAEPRENRASVGYYVHYEKEMPCAVVKWQWGRAELTAEQAQQLAVLLRS